MAEIHTVASLGYRKYDPSIEGTGAAYFPDYQDPSDGHQREAEGVVEPGGLPDCRIADRPGYRENASGILEDTAVETMGADGESCGEEGKRYGEGLRPGKRLYEFAEIQPQEQISYETADIVECAVAVPAGFAPKGILCKVGDAGRSVNDFRGASCPLADEWYDGREDPDAQKQQQFFFPCLFGPWREERHDQIYAQQHIYEPKVPGRIVEVE